MAEDLKNDKPVETKGIDTVTGNDTPVKKDDFIPASKRKFTPAIEYRDPTSQQDAFNMAVSGRAAEGGSSNIKGFSGSIDTKALNAAYAKVDLSEGIPDAYERDKFKSEYGSKMVELFDENSVGVRFERDLEDVYKFKEKQYPYAVKKFIDELDENQAWYSEVGNIVGKAVGETFLNVFGGLGGSIYGGFSALVNWDYEKFWNNDWWEGLDKMVEDVDKSRVVYGGSDYWNFNPNATDGNFFEQKDFLARFISDPIKSLNADIVPTASFVAGIVGQELMATAVTAASGGLGAGSMAAGVARGTRLLQKGAGWAGRMSKSGKALRYLRGLENMDDLAKAAKLQNMTNQYRKGIGQISSMYRSSAYESAIIANDTEESVIANLVSQWKEKNDPDNLGLEPSDAEMAEFQQAASDAGNMAFSLNIPLVGMSNMIQFPRLFLRNYKSASAAKGLGKIKFEGGKHIAAAESNKALKAFGYGKAFLKGPVSEAWEEYAQGAMQAGLAEYYTATYNTPDTRSYMDMLEAMRRQGATSLNTVEGRDSVTLGGLMGLLGLRVPVVMRNKQNRFGFSLKTKNFGGSVQEFKEAKRQYQEAQQKAEWLNNEGNMSPQLRNNFMNSVRHMSTQRDMDKAARDGDINKFKNKEFDQLFSLIHKREVEGLGDAFNQEFDALDNMGIEEFNKTYATEGIDTYDTDSKAEAIAKARKTVATAQKSIRQVHTLANKPKLDILGKVSSAIRDSLKKNPEGNALNPELMTAALQEQMAYLHATMNNTLSREAELGEQIREKTSHGFSFNSLDKVVAQITGINTANGKAEFINKAQEVKAEILKDWKENAPDEYHTNVMEVEPLIDDILQLKVRRGEAAKMYQGLFTPKGAKSFVSFTEKLEAHSAKERRAKSKEIVQNSADRVRNASIENEAKNEASVSHGESPVIDERINQDVLRGIEEIKNIDRETQPGDMIQADTLRILDKNPGLLTLVKKRMEEKGYSVRGIKVAKEFELLSSPENDLLKGVWEELVLIEKEAEALQAANASTMEFDSADDMNQASPTDPEESPSFEKVKGQVLEGMFSFSNRSNRTHTIVNTNDKLIVNDEVVIDGETGRAAPHPAANDPSYPLDPNKVNSPEFLNNKMLEEATHEFEFRVQSAENNKWAKENQDRLNENNYPIEVLYVDPATGEETFISRLPAFIPGESANQLLALRREVLRRDKLKVDPNVKSRAERIKEIGKEIENLDKEIEGKATMDVGSALSEKAQAKLKKLGFTPEMIKEMSDDDIELAKGMSSKEDAKGLVDKYDPAKQQTSEVEAKLNKPFKTVNDGSGTMVAVTTETTEKEGIKKTKFKTETTNKKGEPRTQDNKGYNTFEEAVENLDIDLQSEENETAVELVEALKNSQNKETLPTKVVEIRESTDKSSPFYGLRTATVIVWGEKIDFRLKPKPASIETKTSDVEVEAKPLEEKVAEIKENQQFIQLSEDGSKYVNSKTGKEYQRVTNFIEGEKEEEKGDTTLLDTSSALGTKVDNLVRDFFDNNLQELDSYEIGDREMIDTFLIDLQKVKENMDARGEKVLANDIVLYNDEIGVAGTVDLLTYDAEGKFRIYDMKTMRGNNFDSTYQGEEASKYDSNTYGKSKREKHSEQLSMYRILLHNTHGILADTIGVMPIEIMYESGDSTTDRLNLLKGVSLTPYDVVADAKLKVAQEEIKTEPLEEKRKALKQELSSLSGELVVELDLDSPNVFGKVSDLEGMVESKQEVAETQIAEEFGADALDRATFINDNFQDIIGMIAKSKINIFFDATTKESKRCP